MYKPTEGLSMPELLREFSEWRESIAKLGTKKHREITSKLKALQKVKKTTEVRDEIRATKELLERVRVERGPRDEGGILTLDPNLAEELFEGVESLYLACVKEATKADLKWKKVGPRLSDCGIIETEFTLPLRKGYKANFVFWDNFHGGWNLQFGIAYYNKEYKVWYDLIDPSVRCTELNLRVYGKGKAYGHPKLLELADHLGLQVQDRPIHWPTKLLFVSPMCLLFGRWTEMINNTKKFSAYSVFPEHPACPVRQRQIDWADEIIVVSKKSGHLEYLKKNFNLEGKKVKVLGIENAKELLQQKKYDELEQIFWRKLAKYLR